MQKVFIALKRKNVNQEPNEILDEDPLDVPLVSEENFGGLSLKKDLSGPIKLESQQKRERAINKFKAFLEESNFKSIKELVQFPDDLDIAFCQFFEVNSLNNYQ